MNWNINYGDCELQTYSLNDPNREKFTLKLSCLQGLILLQFESSRLTTQAKSKLIVGKISKIINTTREYVKKSFANCCNIFLSSNRPDKFEAI